MGRTLIGNFKGPKGDKGDPGPQGPMGPQGPVGLVNTDGAVEFEDYTSEGAELPAPVDALAMITSGQKLKNIFSGIRAFCKNMLDSELGSGKMIGDAFSEEKTYAAGEYAIYDNALYEFTAAKAAGSWDPDVAALTTIAEVMRELNGNMTTVSDEIAKKAGKTGNTYTGTQTVRKTVSITHNQYRNAHFVARNGGNQYSRACISFENEGVAGGILFLDNDGRLKYFDNNTDKTYVITWQ